MSSSSIKVGPLCCNQDAVGVVDTAAAAGSSGGSRTPFAQSTKEACWSTGSLWLNLFSIRLRSSLSFSVSVITAVSSCWGKCAEMPLLSSLLPSFSLLLLLPTRIILVAGSAVVFLWILTPPFPSFSWFPSCGTTVASCLFAILRCLVIWSAVVLCSAIYQCLPTYTSSIVVVALWGDVLFVIVSYFLRFLLSRASKMQSAKLRYVTSRKMLRGYVGI